MARPPPTTAAYHGISRQAANRAIDQARDRHRDRAVENDPANTGRQRRGAMLARKLAARRQGVQGEYKQQRREQNSAG